MKYQPIFTNTNCKQLANKVLCAKTWSQALEIIRETAETLPKNSNWHRDLMKLANDKPFTVFAKGNTKLPFFNFSALPGYTCPGADACLEYCYSYTAWRYPAAFCRQLRNTLLLKFKRSIITDVFMSLPQDTVLRLYVDGDIDSMSTLGFWFGLLNRRQDIRAYGYSKSLNLFAMWHDQGLPFPTNYLLNLSSGGKYDNSLTHDLVATLPITRGDFVGVETSKRTWPKGFARYDSREYHRAVRAAAPPKAFSCPGHCGPCVACADDRFIGIPIAIGIH
jgi:Gene product 88